MTLNEVGSRTGEPADGRQSEARRDDQADRGGDHEADIPRRNENARRRERVQPEKARAREEGERHERDASVAVTPSRHVRHGGEHDTDGAPSPGRARSGPDGGATGR